MQPSFADGDPTPAVERVAVVRGNEATALHRFPCTVFGRTRVMGSAASSVSARAVGKRLPMQAAAGTGVTEGQVTLPNDSFVTAVAATAPEEFSASFFAGRLDQDETAEPLAWGEMVDNVSSHCVNLLTRDGQAGVGGCTSALAVYRSKFDIRKRDSSPQPGPGAGNGRQPVGTNGRPR